MTVDVLAIAAHPDDVELTCGGTLIKMAKRGYKTGVLDLTAGEMGTRVTTNRTQWRPAGSTTMSTLPSIATTSATLSPMHRSSSTVRLMRLGGRTR